MRPKVQRDGGPDSCWEWTGGLDRHGYGRHGGKLAHRVVYEILASPIPPGLDLDHTCHTSDESCPGGIPCPHRRCVNPDHLEPVTRGENLRRASSRARLANAFSCAHGHLWSDGNEYITPDDKRVCRACAADRQRQYRQRQRQKAKGPL